MVVLGYVCLRQWEASADLLLREQARDTASMAAEKIEIMLALQSTWGSVLRRRPVWILTLHGHGYKFAAL